MCAECLLLLHWEVCLLHFERGKWGFPAAAIASPAFPRLVQNADGEWCRAAHTSAFRRHQGEYQAQTGTAWPPGFSAHTGNVTREERGQSDESMQHLPTAVLITALRQC